MITSPGESSSPKNSRANEIGNVADSMNCGMPTDSAARRPCQSWIVALRSLDWLRIGVVAVRETNVAISKQTVSIAERMTSAVTASTDSGVDRVTIEATIGNPLADRASRLPAAVGIAARAGHRSA